MRNLVFALAMVVTVVGASFAHAAGEIAVVDIQQVVSQSEAAKKANEKLKKMAEESDDKIRELQKPLVEDQKKLEGQRSVLSQEQFLEREAELRKKVNDYRNEAQDIQGRIERESIAERRRITEAALEVVNEIAKKRQYKLVVHRNVALFTGDAVDITADVLKEVNKRLD